MAPAPVASKVKGVHSVKGEVNQRGYSNGRPKERIIRNDGVGGSNPSCGTTNLCNYYFNLRPRSPKIGVKFLNVLDTILPPGRRKSPAPAAVSAGSWCRPSTRTIGCLGPFCLRWRTDRRQPDPHSAISREPILQPLFRGAIIVDIFFLRLLHPQEDHHRKGPIDVRNPRCPADRFTDRWPENLTAQATTAVQETASVDEYRTPSTEGQGFRRRVSAR
jgi:hypothetical protein